MVDPEEADARCAGLLTYNGEFTYIATEYKNRSFLQQRRVAVILKSFDSGVRPFRPLADGETRIFFTFAWLTPMSDGACLGNALQRSGCRVVVCAVSRNDTAERIANQIWSAADPEFHPGLERFVDLDGIIEPMPLASVYGNTFADLTFQGGWGLRDCAKGRAGMTILVVVSDEARYVLALHGLQSRGLPTTSPPLTMLREMTPTNMAEIIMDGDGNAVEINYLDLASIQLAA